MEVGDSVFYDQISNLPEGRYQIVDGKVVSY